jgi:hypothetical protein
MAASYGESSGRPSNDWDGGSDSRPQQEARVQHQRARQRQAQQQREQQLQQQAQQDAAAQAQQQQQQQKQQQQQQQQELQPQQPCAVQPAGTPLQRQAAPLVGPALSQQQRQRLLQSSRHSTPVSQPLQQHPAAFHSTPHTGPGASGAGPTTEELAAATLAAGTSPGAAMAAAAGCTPASLQQLYHQAYLAEAPRVSGGGGGGGASGSATPASAVPRTAGGGYSAGGYSSGHGGGAEWCEWEEQSEPIGMDIFMCGYNSRA